MDIYGDGSDGALEVLTGTKVLALNTKHQFTDLHVAAGATLSTSSTDGSVLYILVAGTCRIDGVIDLKGKVRRGGDATGVTIDGVAYTSPGCGYGGPGGSWASGASGGNGSPLGFGGGGAGGLYTNDGGTSNGSNGGDGGPGGANGGAGAGQQSTGNVTGNKEVSAKGANGSLSGGGGGAGGARIVNVGSGTGTVYSRSNAAGRGGNAYGANGSNGANPSGTDGRSSGGTRAYQYSHWSHGGGGAGGNAGNPGVHLVIKARELIINGTLITAGTDGQKGGNGGRGATWSGWIDTWGLGGGGGGGGRGGNITLVYSDSADIASRTEDRSGGAGGGGGTGGTTAGNVTGSSGSSGFTGSTSATKIGRYLRSASDTVEAADQLLWSTNQKPVVTAITEDGTVIADKRFPLRFIGVDNEGDDIEYEIEILGEGIIIPTFYRTITIDHTKIASNLVDFPMYVDITLGTNVANPNGYDVHFQATGGIELDFELIGWDDVTKRWRGWVKVPLVSSSVATVIRAVYGDGAIDTNQSTRTTWRGEYDTVLHFEDGLADSTANQKTVTAAGTTSATGMVGTARSFNGSQNMSLPLDASGQKAITISGWIYITSVSGTGIIYEHGTNYNSDSPAFVSYIDGTSIDVSLRGELGYSMARVARPSLSAWHHYTFVHDINQDGNDENIVYIDGVRVPFTNPHGSNNTTSFLNKTLNIFSRAGTSFRITGMLDELRVYKGSVSLGWAKAEYLNQLNPSTFYTVGSEQEGGQ